MSEAALRPASGVMPVPSPVSIVGSLTWRFVRHGWQTMLPPVVTLCGMPTLVYFLIRLMEPSVLTGIAETSGELKRIYFILTMGSLPTMVLIALFRVRPLYALPVSTRQIINTHLMLGMAAVAVLHLLAVVYYRAVFGTVLPVAGPLMFLIPSVAILSGMAAQLLDARWWRWKPIVVIAVLVWLTRAMITRFDHPAIREGAEWFTPSMAEMLTMLLLAVAGYWLTMTAAVRDRRGDTEPWGNPVELLDQAIVWLRGRRPFRTGADRPTSPLAAQRDYEWQKRGLALPLVVLGVVGLSLIGASHKPLDWFHGLIASFPFLLIVGMSINGLIVGLLDGSKVGGEMDRYQATRPLTDFQLAWAAMRNGLRSSVCSMAVLGAGAMIVYVYARFCGHAHRDLWLVPAQSTLGGSYGYLGALVMAAILGWAGMGFNLSCMSTGRPWIVPTLWLSGMVLLLVGIRLDHLLPDVQVLSLARASTIVVGVLVVMGTFHSFRRATSRQLIPASLWIAGGAAWVVALGILLAWSPRLWATDAATRLVFFAGVAALVPLPVATVPLAISWNRHR